MNARSSTRLLFTSLMLGAAAFTAGPASASDVVIRTPAAPVVVVRDASMWETIPGTRVAWVRDADRPAYDLFRYGTRYYVYNDGNWYTSRTQDGRYVVINDRRVPLAIARVPDTQWRNYPPGWKNPKNPHYNGRHDNGRDIGKRGKSKNY
ncbi:MAG: hypothetical protein ABIU54_05495 [Candidatus Eisenbacteria bacterium]